MPSLPHLFYVFLCIFGFIDLTPNPNNIGIVNFSTEHSPKTWEALKWFAVTAEIVGPDEPWAFSFAVSIEFIQGHFYELLDAPTIKDVNRLPNNESSQINYAICVEYESFLYKYKELNWDKEKVDDVIMQCNKSLSLWILIGEVTNKYEAGRNMWWSVKRNKLKEIRDLVGDKNYYQGFFPNSIPMKYLVEIE